MMRLCRLERSCARTVVPLIVLSAGLISIGVLRPAVAADEPAVEKAETAETAVVTRETLKVEATIDGVFEAARMTEVSLVPKRWTTLTVAGAIAQGESVKKGRPLVTLKTEEVDKQIHDKQIAHGLAQLALEQANKAAKLVEHSTRLEIESAEQAYQTASQDLKLFLEHDRELAVDAAEYSVERARQSLEYSREELRQLERMYKADELTEETEEIVLKRARNDVEASERRLELIEIARDRTLEISLPRQERALRLASDQADLALAKAKIALPAGLKQKQIELDKQRRDFQQSARELAELQAERQAFAQIVAPADGIVYYGECKRGKWATASTVAAALKPGGTLKAHQTFITIVGDGPIGIRADVDEKQLSDIRVGLAGLATATAAADSPLPVEVEKVSRIAVADGKFDVSLVVRGDLPPRIVAGMTCKVTLVAYVNNEALTVPAKSVFTNPDGSRFVWLVTDDGSERKSVTVGRTAGEKIEILTGPAEGQKILTAQPE